MKRIIATIAVVTSAVIGLGGCDFLSFERKERDSAYYLGDVEYKPTTLGYDDDATIADVVAGIADSVVEINIEKRVSGGFLGTQISSGAGSGVLYGLSEDKKDYYVITNHHVVDGASKVEVILTNGAVINASVIGTDADSDVAVLGMSTTGIDLTRFRPVVLPADGYNVRVGDTAIAIGNPLGSLGGSVTCGIVSGLSRQVMVDDTIMTLMQTDASLNPGNSGGGLFNIRGELIGITNSGYNAANVEGLGFAIPSVTVRNVADSIIEYGYVKGKATIGITVLDLTTESNFRNATATMTSDEKVAWFNRYERIGNGLYIQAVTNTDSGLQIGDLIVSITIDGIKHMIDDQAELKYALSLCKAGDRVCMEVKYLDEENSVQTRELWFNILERQS